MDLVPKKKPEKSKTDADYKKRINSLLIGFYGTGPEYRGLAVDEIQKTLDEADQKGVLSKQDGLSFVQKRKKHYDSYFADRAQKQRLRGVIEEGLSTVERPEFELGGSTDYRAMVTRMYIEAGGQEGTGMDIESFAAAYFPKMADGGRIGFGEGSGERTDLDYINLTRLENSKATGKSISNSSKFKALPGYDNITYTDYQDKKTGDVNRKYNVRLRVVEDGKTKVLTKGPKFQNIDSLDDAVKIRNDLRKTNPKNIPIRDPGADAADKARRVEAIRKNEGLPYSYSGTKANPKGHASNIYGKNIITPSEIIYTPQKINMAMSGKKGLGINRSNEVQALDFRIKDTEQKIEDIKKSKMSAAKKKTELAKLDNKLVNYVAKSGGFKVATLSDGSKYGKSFQSLKSLDMFDEFEGMSEKQMNDFIKKYKNMKVKKDTTQADKDNIIKAKIAAENIKNAKKNAARGGGGTQMFDPFKPSGLSPLRKTKYLAGGGPVYGKYAKQIAKLSS